VVVRPESFSEDGSTVVVSLCWQGNGNTCGEATGKGSKVGERLWPFFVGRGMGTPVVSHGREPGCEHCYAGIAWSAVSPRQSWVHPVTLFQLRIMPVVAFGCRSIQIAQVSKGKLTHMNVRNSSCCDMHLHLLTFPLLVR
jgi:hypothetical protein